ncbi:tRNA(Ile)-lysidine synthase [Cladobotryum mycophilum]|uniref:tRNA(Ile)-lysidine synthetase n=1 Tax=Cladobotryum mycophilum TaxID=491253 RepID=A0ABR0S949_9HYPO
MGTQPYVFHNVPKPIAPHEFRDAVLAICRPRFPTARYARPQRIALAISGGVDSMAMAFLFATLLKTYRGIKIADNPTESIYSIIIDHKLRDESAVEASRVSQELKKLGIKSFIRALNWKEQKWQGVDPRSLSNIESLARTMRYQNLGNACRYLQSTNLFFAHHRDDQYETVLMRLLAGHGYRGLQGIREANAIPECYELHGVYKSGLLDDQMQPEPFLSFKPASRAVKQLRLALKDDKKAEPWDQIKKYLGLQEMSMHFPGHLVRDADPRVPYLTPLNSEDGGVMIYRPLLEFDKDRLIATCEANNVSWFEDHTNKDPTLTPRNAIRHLTKSYQLPRALQKSSILALAKRARLKTLLQEAEAHRMLVREGVVKDFDPNAGTLLIELPTFRTKFPSKGRLFSQAREEARKPLRRLTAAIAIRKLIDFVTPERHLPPLANLGNVVDRLFPELSFDAKSKTSQHKAFSMAGVLFDPVSSSGLTKWFLSRAPDGVLRPGEDGQMNRHGHWRSWKTAKIWDGRFWIRVSACVSAKFHVLPFMPAYAKPFRMALAQKERTRFEKILKYYAPGKVRYSLPALYSVEDASGDDPTPILTLLALPSLGIHLPGLERWVRYEARYRHVDVSLLRPSRQRSKVGHIRSDIILRRAQNHRTAREKARKRRMENAL